MTRSDAAPSGWRVVDIVVGAVVAVAFGAVFLVWNGVNTIATPLFVGFPPAQALLYAVWLLPGVLVGLIVRRPGAALLGGVVSAAASAAFGSPYGLDAVLSGFLQGGGAELGFALLLYRAWRAPVAVLAGTLAGLLAAIHDVVLYFATYPLGYQVAYGACAMASGALAGVGAWLLVRALARTGVLSPFAAGRAQERV